MADRIVPKGMTGDVDSVNGKESDVYRWQLILDSVPTDTDTVKNHPLIPTGDKGVKTRNKVNVSPDPSSDKVWNIELSYENPNYTQPVQPQPDDEPDRWNITIDVTSERYEVPRFVDLDGKPYRNVLHEVIEKKETKWIQQIVITYNCLTPEWSSLDYCRGRCNDGPIPLNINGSVRTHAIGTMLLDDYSVSGVVDANGVGIATIRNFFLYNPETWQEKYYPNISLYQWVLVSGVYKRVPILDDNKQPVSIPQYLTALGVPIADGASLTTADMNLFHEVEEANFDLILGEIIDG
jgi:hypothetical protein